MAYQALRLLYITGEVPIKLHRAQTQDCAVKTFSIYKWSIHKAPGTREPLQLSHAGTPQSRYFKVSHGYDTRKIRTVPLSDEVGSLLCSVATHVLFHHLPELGSQRPWFVHIQKSIFLLNEMVPLHPLRKTPKYLTDAMFPREAFNIRLVFGSSNIVKPCPKLDRYRVTHDKNIEVCLDEGVKLKRIWWRQFHTVA